MAAQPAAGSCSLEIQVRVGGSWFTTTSYENGGKAFVYNREALYGAATGVDHLGFSNAADSDASPWSGQVWIGGLQTAADKQATSHMAYLTGTVAKGSVGGHSIAAGGAIDGVRIRFSSSVNIASGTAEILAA